MSNTSLTSQSEGFRKATCYKTATGKQNPQMDAESLFMVYVFSSKSFWVYIKMCFAQYIFSRIKIQNHDSGKGKGSFSFGTRAALWVTGTQGLCVGLAS